MDKNEYTSARVAADAALFLTHSGPMIKRMKSLKDSMDNFADDIAGMIIMMETGQRIAGSALTQAPNRPVPDDDLTDAEKREKNG